MTRNIIITRDGSHTLYLPDVDESYHSVHGAVREAQHVYIRAALREVLPLLPEIRLLEVGFGTGLNALLTLLANDTQKKIYYCGVEAFPLTASEVQHLNYPELLQIDRQLFQSLHDAAWDAGYEEITPTFYLKKLAAPLQAVPLPASCFNVVYFDAFAPAVQPELWESAIFEKIYASISAGGVLTTYSAKGSVRRTLQQTGFTVERLPAPAGKREMLRARKMFT
ncbi:MAG: tRNA (5-methylaminomethyl-2-thiouridine)(34)-methyltransferase MnmD [Bacteroidales bacterium]|nr:tRNA (5-methylaminomethyl-2-thiouridine)(34)-methyltransferase MnmD [Bacteroidales bacterium]